MNIKPNEHGQKLLDLLTVIPPGMDGAEFFCRRIDSGLNFFKQAGFGSTSGRNFRAGFKAFE